MKLINEEIINQNGCFRHVRRWYEGWVDIPGGIFINGITGKETVVTCDVIKPIFTREISELSTK